MLKTFSRLSAFLFALLLVPFSVFAAEEGEAVAEASATSDLLHYSLLILSIVTLVLMIYLSAKDNG